MRSVGSIFSYLWKIINGTRKFILNLVFFIILAIFIASLMQGEDPIEVPENGIMVGNPARNINIDKKIDSNFKPYGVEIHYKNINE